MEQPNYIVFLSVKEDGVVSDHPLRPFDYMQEAETYILGYVDAILNHTDDDSSEDEIKGLFSIRDAAGEPIKEKKEGKNAIKTI
jgi:hypothetical protein